MLVPKEDSARSREQEAFERAAASCPRRPGEPLLEWAERLKAQPVEVDQWDGRLPYKD